MEKKTTGRFVEDFKLNDIDQQVLVIHTEIMKLGGLIRILDWIYKCSHVPGCTGTKTRNMSCLRQIRWYPEWVIGGVDRNGDQQLFCGVTETVVNISQEKLIVK